MQQRTILLPYLVATICMTSYAMHAGGNADERENYAMTVSTITRWRNALDSARQKESHVDPLGCVHESTCNTCCNTVYPLYEDELEKLHHVKHLRARERDRILHCLGYRALVCFSQCPTILHGSDLYDLYYNSQCVDTRRKIPAEQERKELLYIVGALRWSLRDYVSELERDSSTADDVNIEKQTYDKGVWLSKQADKELARYAPRVDLKHVPPQVRSYERELEKSRYKYPTDPDIKNVATPEQLANIVKPVNIHANNNGYISPIERAPHVLSKIKTWYTY